MKTLLNVIINQLDKEFEAVQAGTVRYQKNGYHLNLVLKTQIHLDCRNYKEKGKEQEIEQKRMEKKKFELNNFFYH